MSQLRLDGSEITKRDTEIVVVGPEKEEAFVNFFLKNKLNFIGLPDPRHTILKMFGQEIDLFKLGRMPAQLIIDKAGLVRYVHYGHNMADIPDNKEIINLIDEINTTQKD